MKRTTERKTKYIRFDNQRAGTRRSRIIPNQTTLVSTLTNLMKGQKSLVGILRVKNTKCESTIPVGFKLDTDKIPQRIRPLTMHPDNLIEIQVDGFKAIPAMIVAIGGKSNFEHFQSAF